MGRLAIALLALTAASGARAATNSHSGGADSHSARAAHSRSGPRSSVGRRIAREASRLVGADSLRINHDDCSGFVELVYRRAHVQLDGSSQELRRIAARRHALRFGRARPGDLVFFHDTIEGRHGITHVGIIEAVARDGAATFVHRASEGVVRSRLDLRRPHTGLDARGRRRNDILRRADRGSRARLSGELFAGFASADRLARAQ
jgi:cell wall-associated NlpC family hydrolase